MTEPSLRGLDVEAHLRDPARKQQFVTPMFDIIAPRYDDFTRLFSFGMDVKWKRAMLAALAGRVSADAEALDIACGTGDLAFALQGLAPGVRVRGIDASIRMIAEAQRRAALATATADIDAPEFHVGDMMALPAESGSLQLVTGGYALRNAPDWRGALAECARVLAPGGVLATLDFYRPSNPVWRALLLGYLRVAGELVGYAWHGHGIVYGYIAPSIAHFTTVAEYERELAALGLVVERRAVHLLGGVAWHVARKR